MSSRADRRHPRAAWRLGSVLFAAALAAVFFSVFHAPTRSALVVGEPSPETFVAPVDLQVVDRLATELRRQAARAQVPELTSPDPNLKDAVLQRLEALDVPPATLSLLQARYGEPIGVRVDPARLPELTRACPWVRAAVALDVSGWLEERGRGAFGRLAGGNGRAGVGTEVPF